MDKLEQLEVWLRDLETFWANVPGVARKIDSWPLGEQLNYTEEEPAMARQRQSNIEESLADLTDDQERRFQAVLELAKKNRPLLDQIMNGP